MGTKNFIMNGPASEAIMDEPEAKETEKPAAPEKKTAAKKTAAKRS
jgi:hypothetical protein